MKAKTDLQEKARLLYFEGKSYRAIAKELSVSKGSVSTWCKRYVGLRKKVL